MVHQLGGPQAALIAVKRLSATTVGYPGTGLLSADEVLMRSNKKRGQSKKSKPVSPKKKQGSLPPAPARALPPPTMQVVPRSTDNKQKKRNGNLGKYAKEMCA